MQHTRTVFIILFFSLFTSARLLGLNPPPPHDTVCLAQDLGVLDLPGACPGYPYGDTITVSGSTVWATYNTFDFSPVHCFPNGSPDVWYKFRSTGSYIYLEMSGFNGLDSFFVKLHHSQGTCLSLVPLHCEISTTGFMAASFLTPDVGGEYYLQIGGSNFAEVGDFVFTLKSFNDCASCVKNADVELTPAPWFGRYGTDDTVRMCVTVDRWEIMTTSNLHSIIPVFGSDWDVASVTPVTIPSSVVGGWGWFTNVSTPLGNVDGFFFDPDLNGDPTDNQGDSGNLTSTWTGCWDVVTQSSCNTFDLSVDIYALSDHETGTGSPVNPCQEYVPIHLGLSGWCCTAPELQIFPGTSCAAYSNVAVYPDYNNTTDTFNIVVYDDNMQVVAFQNNVIGSTIFTNILPGDYLIEVYNVSDGCISFASFTVQGAFDISFTQTAIGCGAGTGSVVATPFGGASPYTYQWLNVSTSNWVDSLAFNLDQGTVIILVTDALGCTVTDSFYVTTLQAPGVEFYYAEHSYCHNDDTIQVYSPPFTGGGQFNLVSPAASGITVDVNNGTIYLNNTAQTLPYWIYVSYSVGGPCPSSWIDSVYIVQQPPAPSPTSATSFQWCIGSPAPVIGIVQANPYIPWWYDGQTTANGFAYSYTTPLNASSPAGTYLYGFIYFADFTGGCASLPTIFSIVAVPSPLAVFTGDTIICEGDTAVLTAFGSTLYTYQWSPAPVGGSATDQNTFTAPSISQTYTCTVSDGSCTTSGTVSIGVLPAAACTSSVPSDSELVVYHGFTPNGDGINDTWIIDNMDPAADYTVNIYNRWGGNVWHWENYDNINVVWRGLDGRGNTLPPGTYYFIIYENGIHKKHGWVELSR